MESSKIDQRHIWHPFTQHQTAPAPLQVTHARQTSLFLADGRTLIDAISSWWVNLHGHCHPYLVKTLAAQAEKLEQVIFADFTHDEAIEFTKVLLPLLPTGLNRVFFSDNGSTAVEVALKMAIQYWHNRGVPKRKIVSFAGAYHGDTFGAMAVSSRSAFTAAFAPLLFDVLVMDPPRRGVDPEPLLRQFDELIERHDDIAAFIYEPLVQGTAGMVMQDPAVQERLLARAREAGIMCIADEVMTGFGRTGELFASQAMKTAPDIMCLGKGITGGMLPISVTVAREDIFEEFLGGSKERAFLHGHSYTANSLGCRVAKASLELLVTEECSQARKTIEARHWDFKDELEQSSLARMVREVRVQGTILACELEAGEQSGYFYGLRDAMAAYFIEQGVLLRPLGNVVYVLPPYCISAAELNTVYGAIRGFIQRHLAK